MNATTNTGDAVLVLLENRYYVMITIRRVKTSEKCTSIKFDVQTTLNESYSDLWYSEGMYGKPNIFGENKTDGMSAFLERCIMQNIRSLEKPAAGRRIIVPIAYRPEETTYVAPGSEVQLELPLLDDRIVPFASSGRRRKKSTAARAGKASA